MSLEIPSDKVTVYDNVHITLSSEQWTKEESSEPITLITRGVLTRYHQPQVWTLSYEESSDDGMAGVRTNLNIYDEGGIRLTRQGAIIMDVFFEKGNHYMSSVDTPFGQLDVSIFTNVAEGEINEEGGFIDLSYAMNLRQRETVSTKIHIQVKTT